MAQQAALLGRREPRSGAKLARAADVVQQRRRKQEVVAQARVELRRLAGECRHPDGVLEQSARVRVVGLGGWKAAQQFAQARIGEQPAAGRAQARMRELGGEEVEEAFQLVRVAPHCRHQRRRVDALRRLERSHVDLEPARESARRGRAGARRRPR